MFQRLFDKLEEQRRALGDQVFDVLGESTRLALNSRARALLKAEGVLTGAPLTVAGRELMVGDEVVARRNDRTLRAPGRRAFVKNGSVGTVTAVDADDRSLLIAFDREGAVRLPAATVSLPIP